MPKREGIQFVNPNHTMTTVPDAPVDQVAADIKRLSEFEATFKALEKERKEIKDRLKEALPQRRTNSVSAYGVVVTIREKKRSSVDSKALRDHIGEELYSRFVRVKPYLECGIDLAENLREE